MNISVIISIWHDTDTGVMYPGWKNELGSFAARIFLLSAVMFVIEYIILTIKYLLAILTLCVVGKYSDYPRL